MLMKSLIDKDASVQNLRLEFTIEARDKNVISKEAFKKIIDFEIKGAAPMAPEKLSLLADLFETKSGTQVDFEEFLEQFATT